MTKNNMDKIDEMVVKISEYLYNISVEYETFDINLIELSIDAHTNDEENAEMNVKVNIDDCVNENELAKSAGKQTDGLQNDANVPSVLLIDNKNKYIEKASDVNEWPDNDGRPVLINIDLETASKEMARAFEKRKGSNKPVLLHVTKLPGRNEYVFLNK
ncbi:unnamed protein product [Diatraea saccharalis]|uniref:Uncharacterized protein n=1 Tax=Diatraea saccharalis TaxID=40085 RepID=A0A9N9R6H2_9NEOP|nr:unnamed protein product [Diatraea saccharalis]